MTANLHQLNFRLRFQFSDWTLFSVGIRVCAKQLSLLESLDSTESGLQPDYVLPPDCRGFLSRGLPDKYEGQDIFVDGDFICYVLTRMPRYFIEFSGNFDDYVKNNFSSKTRSSIRRKIKKFAEHSGGELEWKTYSTPKEMEEFHLHARQVATNTYQEKLFNGALPNDKGFLEQMRRETKADRVRAYLLFHAGRPVSYLYLRSNNETLTYDYLGYLPEYASWSVGTVLQWVALESLFEEGKFSYFDFTEGEGDHKRLFATNSIKIANIIFLQRNLNNHLLIVGHWMCNGFSKFAGKKLEHWGFKKAVKNFIRFGLRKA